jgi:hypothetical protein
MSRPEARGFKDDAAEAFTPSMRQRIEMEDLYHAPSPEPATCPVSLDEMLRGQPGG